MMMTVDVDVNAWYINHITKDVKINTHAMLWYLYYATCYGWAFC